MIELNPAQRKGLSTALYGMANITFAALVISQFLTAAFKAGIFVVGLIFTVTLYIMATALNKEIE
ncbi:MAG: hypothetical protein HY210_04435 [Candidatus Omnitrophica bacterium]|nr:hypothetical protein [Candidatus Omnitrophota bacterium]